METRKVPQGKVQDILTSISTNRKEGISSMKAYLKEIEKSEIHGELENQVRAELNPGAAENTGAGE